MIIQDKTLLLAYFATLTKRIYHKEIIPKINPNFYIAGIVITDILGEPVAICTLYDNLDLQYGGEKAVCFGNFESINDADTVQKMMYEALQWTKNQGKTQLIGPMNGSTWDNYRLAIDNFSYKYVLDLEHPPYYAELLEAVENCQLLSNYHTKIDRILKYDVDKCGRAETYLKTQNLTYRNLNLENYEAELSNIYRFCMISFQENLLFTPLLEADFKAKYLPLKPFLQEKYILLAESHKGEIKGLMFAIPDFINPMEKGIVLKTLARSPENQYVGLGTYLGKLLYDQMILDGFQYAIHAFMEQSNVSNNLSSSFSGEILKKYRLYLFS
jgi:hypothetical protein